jgi:hypothetical protein
MFKIFYKWFFILVGFWIQVVFADKFNIDGSSTIFSSSQGII